VPGAVATLAFCTYGSNPYGLTQTANRAIGLEATLHQVLEPVAMIIRKVSINDDKPNELEIVRISKPAPIDFKDLEEKFAALSVSGGDNLPAIPTNIVADEKRLKDDSSYYGEIKGTSNINPYTGQAY
jgi:hypothetical protein